MSATNRMVSTSHAEIAYRESSGTGLPVLLLHGNSTSKEVFEGLTDGPLGETYRMIAIDLPGHGGSSDAREPSRTYTMPGYATCAVEVLDRLGIDQVAIYGWSLGGHIALEMIPHVPGLVGVMISGAPPIRSGLMGMLSGFKLISDMRLFSKDVLSQSEIDRCLKAAFEGHATAAHEAALKRTDGRARKIMSKSLIAGRASDQKAIAEHSPVPLAIVNGADDALINVRYVGRLAYRNLWDDHYYLFRGVGHAPFLTAPQLFEPVFARFLADMEKRAQVRIPAPQTGRVAA